MAAWLSQTKITSNKLKVLTNAELYLILKHPRILLYNFQYKEVFLLVFAMGESGQRRKTKQKQISKKNVIFSIRSYIISKFPWAEGGEGTTIKQKIGHEVKFKVLQI